jgi:Asp-tRNA(Asn)/Glu-tRNA(Gln) amidotransferase A subunit family amidase
VLPCGLSSAGLPLGLQIVGPPDAEALVLAAGHAYETMAAMGPLRPDPAARPAAVPAGLPAAGEEGA